LGQVAVISSKDATPTPTLPPQGGGRKDQATYVRCLWDATLVYHPVIFLAAIRLVLPIIIMAFLKNDIFLPAFNNLNIH
jgi:hypothetical protein